MNVTTTSAALEGMNHYFEHEASKKEGLLALAHKKKLGDFEPALLNGIENWLGQLIHR